MKKAKLLAVVIAALVMYACGSSAAVYNPSTPVRNKNITQIEDAIYKVCAKIGWKAQKISDGTIEATLYTREHIAIVHILYAENGYTIKYFDSTKLNYSEKNGTIHGNYNRWVDRLDRNIAAALAE